MNVQFHILYNTSSFIYSARQNKGNESGSVQRSNDGETKEACESYTAVLTRAEPRVKANVKESLPLDCFAPFVEPTSPCAAFLLCCDIGGACPAWLCSQGCFLVGARVPRGELSFSSQPLDDDPSQPTKSHPLGIGLSLGLLHKSVVSDTWLSLTPPIGGTHAALWALSSGRSIAPLRTRGHRTAFAASVVSPKSSS
ncbi:unnamed protein product, partial [Ixodes persulcatus]